MSLCVAAVVMCLLCGLHLQETKADLSNASCKSFSDLASSLFDNNENKLNLSLAFFPLQDNPPNFVAVTYNFGNGNSQVWFWSAHTSHFLHPFQVFQFMSLLFSKPEPYYYGEVTITMKPECADPGKLPNSENSLLQLLTQRLKLYAEKGGPGITVSDTYSAKAYDNETLTNLLTDEAKHTTNIIICTVFFVIVFSLLIIVFILIGFFCSKSHKESNWTDKVKNNQPAVLSFTILSIILNVYIFILDCTAVGYWHTFYHEKEDTARDKLYSFENQRTVGPIWIVFLFDIIFFAWWLFTVGFAACIKCGECTEKNGNERNEFALLILSLSVLTPIFCVIAHSPYIAIAYLNDGSHASSIFIYYTILCYVFFGVMRLYFNWCTKKKEDESKNGGEKDETGKKKDDESKKGEEKEDKIKAGEEKEEKIKTGDSKEDKSKKGVKTDVEALKNKSDSNNCTLKLQMTLLFITILLLFGLVVTVTCYFVLIPINKSISDAPNRLLSIYQSGGFLIGSFIVYKVIKYFYNKKNEEEKVSEKVSTK